MPFSNDEQIVIFKRSKLQIATITFSILLFISSLFNVAYCTTNSCRTAIEIFLMGWMVTLSGGAAFSWLANPFLIVSIILLVKNKKHTWIVALPGIFFSVSFLFFDTVIENEAGHYATILKVKTGYWLWLLSNIIIFLGSAVFAYNHKKHFTL